MRSSAIVLRSAVALVTVAAALGACGDDDTASSPPVSFIDGGTSGGPKVDGSPNDTSANDTSTNDTGAKETGAADTGSDTGSDSGNDTGAPDGGSDADADADAGADADATADADADAGNDLPIGNGPFMIAYAGRGLGIDVRPVASSSFAGNNLDAWSAEAPFSEVFDHGTTKLSNIGVVDALVTHGHWSDGTATVGAQNFTWPANGGDLYVIGERATNIPTAGTLTLTQAGGTPAIVSDGTDGPGSINGTAALAYQADGTAKVGLSVTISLGIDTYVIATTGGSVDPTTSTAITQKPNGGFGFTSTVASVSALCGGTCNVSVQGFVAGPKAEHLAIVVHVFKGAGGAEKTVSGAVVFKKP